jgi:pimeloyl-ACP methyl ester carboxylesterase
VSTAQFASALDNTLERLGRDWLDLYYLHFPYSARGVGSWMRAMARAVKAGALERFGVLACEVLLLGGSRSARNLTASLDGLGQVLPGARRVVLHGTGHTAADNSQKPDRVAAELHRFFSMSSVPE